MEAGMAERILGTICVHKISPACAVMICPCGGKSKNARPRWSRRLPYGLNFEIRSRFSGEAEPTAALSLCQIYIKQKGGLLHGEQSLCRWLLLVSEIGSGILLGVIEEPWRHVMTFRYDS
jgi:hypothetical protein